MLSLFGQIERHLGLRSRGQSHDLRVADRLAIDFYLRLELIRVLSASYQTARDVLPRRSGAAGRIAVHVNLGVGGNVDADQH